MGLVNGEFLVGQLLRQLKVDAATSDMGAQLVSRYATSKDKSALVKAWVEAALTVTEKTVKRR